MSRPLALAFLWIAISGCTRAAALVSPAPEPEPPPPPPIPPPAVALPCADAVETLLEAPRDLPGFDAGARGAIVRCAAAGRLSLDEVRREIGARGSVPPALATGVSVYRIAYRARRASGASEASSLVTATVFLPDQPSGDLAVIYAHGTVGLAPRCAPSREPAAAMPLAFAASGLATIAPDYAGFGLGAAIHGWMSGEDEARSLFDGARALVKLLSPERAPARFVFAGHSQGGHAVIAAQALSRSEELPAPIVGVLAISPMWFSSTLFAGIAHEDAWARRDVGSQDLLWTLFYFHGHGELFDGPGGGLLPLKKERRGAVAAMLDTRCVADLDGQFRGARASDVFDRGFTDAVTTCLANRASCGPVTKAWADRMRADRPQADKAGPPIALWAGGQDENIPRARARCGIDALRRAGLGADKLTVCVDPAATHRGVYEKNLAPMLAWVRARASGGIEPPPCPGEAGLDANGKAVCSIEYEISSTGGAKR